LNLSASDHKRFLRCGIYSLLILKRKKYIPHLSHPKKDGDLQSIMVPNDKGFPVVE
jgi:hypothetical protein